MNIRKNFGKMKQTLVAEFPQMLWDALFPEERRGRDLCEGHFSNALKQENESSMGVDAAGMPAGGGWALAFG